MTAIEKYYDLLSSNPQILIDNLALKVSAPWWKAVEIHISMGNVTAEQPISFADIKVFLKPDEIDNLIERLKIVKDALIENDITKKVGESHD